MLNLRINFILFMYQIDILLQLWYFRLCFFLFNRLFKYFIPVLFLIFIFLLTLLLHHLHAISRYHLLLCLNQLSWLFVIIFLIYLFHYLDSTIILFFSSSLLQSFLHLLLLVILYFILSPFKDFLCLKSGNIDKVICPNWHLDFICID